GRRQACRSGLGFLTASWARVARRHSAQSHGAAGGARPGGRGGEAAGQGSEVELAGLEPATSWVRFTRSRSPSTLAARRVAPTSCYRTRTVRRSSPPSVTLS